MAGKRKLLPEADPHHEERRRKRRATASVSRSLEQESAHWPAPGKDLREVIAEQVWFLENIASAEDFLRSNKIVEITSTLETARDVIDDIASGQAVPRDLMKRAEHLFEALKAKYAPKLSKLLVNFAEKVALKSTLSHHELIESCSVIEQNLHETRDYAYEYGLGAQWEKAITNVQEKHDEEMRQLQSRGLVDGRWSPTTVEASTSSTVSTPSMVNTLSKQSIDSLTQPPCPMELLQGPRNVAKANEILDHLIAYYERQVVKAPKTELSEIFHDLHTIKFCISRLFSDSKELKSTLQQILSKEKIHAYHAWRLRFEAVWATPAISEIQQRFRDLKKLTDSQPLGRAELICFEFAKDIRSLAMEWDGLESASPEEWNYMAPRFVSEASAAKAADDFEQDYLAFQDQTYADAELSRLWLLVWRTLKVVQFPLPEEPAEVLLPGEESKVSKVEPFAIERAFFESDGQPSPNQLSLSSFVQTGDVNNPQWIEVFVSKYCDHVAKCHDEKEKYYWQFSTMEPKPVPKIVVTTLQASNQQPTPHPEWNMLLHRIVLRLNRLLGGQKVLKRWWHDKETQELAYLDVSKSSAGIRERGQGRSSGGAATTDCGNGNKEKGNGGSDKPFGRSNLGSQTGGAAGNGGQDRDGSSDGNGGDRKNQGGNSTSPNGTSSISSNIPSEILSEDEENQTCPARTLPIPTREEPDAFAKNSASPESRQLPFLGLADDEAAAAGVERLLREFGDSVSVNPMASSVSPDSNQENFIPPVDAGPLATRVLSSDFTWAQYPLGETRASERAQSVQIAREMRQRGITTSGPHVEDVQNIALGPLRLTSNPEDMDASQTGKMHLPPCE